MLTLNDDPLKMLLSPYPPTKKPPPLPTTTTIKLVLTKRETLAKAENSDDLRFSPPENIFHLFPSKIWMLRKTMHANSANIMLN